MPGPQELPGDVVVVASTCQPVVVAVRVLAADERLVGEAAVVGLVQVLLVVVADEVEVSSSPVLAGQLRERRAERHRSCRVLLL